MHSVPSEDQIYQSKTVKIERKDVIALVLAWLETEISHEEAERLAELGVTPQMWE